ncbi:MAG TPA: DUF2800 domain-containing protein [Planctomycetota bacterium]|nr:DUF2800 domain-containing protein [Planctomycetota bacterium]
MKTIEDYLRPSAVTANSICAAAPAMQAAVVNAFGEEEAADEADVGTKIHHYVAEVIEIWRDHGDVEWGKVIASICNDAQRDGLDTWSVRCIQLCAEFARDLIAKHKVERENVLTEQRLNMEGAGFRRGGTADLVLILPFKRIIVVDWKAGFLDQGDADQHDQLGVYGASAAVTYLADDVIVYLFQPRAERERRATAGHYDAKKLRDTAAWSVAVNDRCRQPNPEVTPAYDACKHCKALHRCAPAKEWTVNVLEAIALIGKPTDPDAWGEAVAAAKIAEKAAGTTVDMAKAHLAGGGEITGWSLQGSGSTTKIDAAQAIELARKGGFLDQLLPFASFKTEAAKVLDGIAPAVSVVPKSPSLKPAKSAA